MNIPISSPNTFYRTITQSKEWKEWSKKQEQWHREASNTGHGWSKVYDMKEAMQCGWISPKHFQDFLKFVRENYDT